MNRQDRMNQEHPRSREAHDLPDALAHLRLVTVDGAVGAGRFLLPERASLETPPRIFMKFAALRAEIITRAVPTVAVDSHHRFNRLLLSEYSAASVVSHNYFSLLFYP